MDIHVFANEFNLRNCNLDFLSYFEDYSNYIVRIRPTFERFNKKSKKKNFDFFYNLGFFSIFLWQK